MGEIRSPYFSIDQEHLKDNAEIRSPYFSSGGDYLGVNAEIRSPYFSFDTQDYHGDNAGIHSSYFSAADYHGEDAEIPSGTFFHQDNIVENPYNAETFVEQYIVQNTYNAEKLIQQAKAEELYSDLEAGAFLEKIWNTIKDEEENIRRCYEEYDLAYEYLNRYNASASKPSDKEILHFTDLVRSSLSVNHPDPRSDEPIGKFYSATKLHEAAINFKELRNECLLDVKFSSTKGELRIPRLRIDDNTELLFGNLIALEQCLYKREDQYICHYVKLLYTLVAKPKDADLLIKNKIIGTDRDGASVKNLIDNLSAETSEEYSIYCNLYKQLDQHYQDSWLKNSAYFREVYFGNLWRSTATVSATVLLLFTFVQTICAVVALR
ncbi:hypothetical protein H0E87_024124 [Populus deltoides]|uniref:Uncharacterized protein n=1 Tax=Populus deltoides TaxID=3696 RepID=A0A8T2X8J1_POPDE|nr:hypothetical protein H0E87_024124 [Populus deltoides]